MDARVRVRVEGSAPADVLANIKAALATGYVTMFGLPTLLIMTLLAGWEAVQRYSEGHRQSAPGPEVIKDRLHDSKRTSGPSSSDSSSRIPDYPLHG